jgi:peptide/nickel transport system ATP-binding protein
VSEQVQAPVAQVRDLVVTFRRTGQLVRAVRGVDLEVERGEILGLVGESGSGKTVLGQTILGLIRPGRETLVSGSVVVEDVPLLTADGEARRRLLREHVGAVFQDPMTSLNPSMRIGEQIGEICESEDAAVAALESAGLGHARTRLRSYPHQLSGGQRQRVMIAMAVARRPSIVVADEPTTALDVTIQAQVLALIRKLRDDVGSSFLLITHDLGVAAEIADRIAVMYAGRIVETAPARGLLASPMHPYSRGLLGSRDSLYGASRRDLPPLRGLPPDPTGPDAGCAFAPRCALAVEACRSIPALAARGDHLVACWRDAVGAAAELVPTETETATAGLREPVAVMAASAAPVVMASASVTPGGPTSAAPVAVAPPVAAGADQPMVALCEARRAFVVRHSLGRSSTLAALRGIDLDLATGESLAIVGESGCGKSTLLRVLAGLETLDGGSFVRRPDARVQMVFQDSASSLTPWLSVEELIAERVPPSSGRTRAQKKERVGDLLGLVGLPRTVARAKSRQLSGGQNQRVALARAVASEPMLLLADEPTSSLDVSLAATVLNLIQDLRRRLGFALVFVTHDLAIARTVSERLAVMYLGEIVEMGPTRQVLTAPRHPYARALVRAQPGQGASAAGRLLVKGEPPNPLDIPSGCPYHPRCVDALESCATDAQGLLPVAATGHLVRCVLRDAQEDGSTRA